MSWSHFLSLFGLICLFFTCKGDVSPPSSGNKMILLPGSTAKIEWTFNDKISDVFFRSWAFTSTYPTNRTTTLATISFNDSVAIVTNVPTFAVQKPSTLVLKNVGRHHDGVYKFAVVAKASNTDSAVTVIIVVAPTITFSCPNPSTVNEGDNFTCLCKAEGGRPTPDVTWYDKNDVQVGETEKGEQSLNLTNVNETHIGNYTCKAQSHVNVTRMKSVEVNVRLNYKPKDTNITIKPEVAEVGSLVEITCKSGGLPEPSYAIFHNGSKINDGGTFIIKNVDYHHNGTYECVATNKLGNDSDSANLTVIGPPSPTIMTSATIITSEITPSRQVSSSVTEAITPSKNQTTISSTACTTTCIPIHTTTCIPTCTHMTTPTPLKGDNSGPEDCSGGTEWYIIVVTLVSGIIIGIILSFVVFRVRKSRKLTNSEPSKFPVDTTYQELDLTKMNKEDNYQSLRVNAARNDGKNDDESNYAELNKTREVENSYQSLT
ncbi:opioid-binding protein/cell adhesion molecule homolog [Dendronephthya gigantea]|uniref:opioid-binding protein/cell adhesion molecule homolog n=1 Tax=Dendronephthya gigantea TaxID=151771 RepID=UPI00106964E7|nr:opioid-binding protein/cell adhesion molecule homolog [Dendronephthya gigantea]